MNRIFSRQGTVCDEHPSIFYVTRIFQRFQRVEPAPTIISPTVRWSLARNVRVCVIIETRRCHHPDSTGSPRCERFANKLRARMKSPRMYRGGRFASEAVGAARLLLLEAAGFSRLFTYAAAPHFLARRVQLYGAVTLVVVYVYV